MASQSSPKPISGPGPAAIPAARPRRRNDHESTDGGSSNGESSDGEDMAPNEFDLLLSRSVQSAGPVMLESESVEYSMLRNTRTHSRSRAHARTRSQRRRDSAVSPYSPGPLHSPGVRAVASESERRPDEETPLLLTPAASAGAANAEADAEADANADDSDADSGSAHGTSVKSDSSSSSSSSSSSNPYLGGISRARFWVIFVQIEVIYFVACFDGTIMASSHPVITSYFGSSNTASWLSTAFLLTSTSFQPLLGSLSDVVGRKIPFIVTTGVFLVGTLWCALAGSMTSFIVARAVCGFGAGGQMALGSIMVSDMVPIEIRGAFQSYINMAYGVGAMLGAGLGGVMADYLGWRWEFGCQVPLLAVLFVICVFTIPANIGLYNKPKQDIVEAMKRFDFTGSALLSTSVTFLILGLTLGGNVFPWSDRFVIGSLAVFVVLFPLLLYVETHAFKPIMPMRLILKAPFRNLIFSNFIGAFIANGINFNVPIFFQAVLLTSATESGLSLVVSSAVASTAGVATGFLITYTRRLKWPLVLGAGLIVVGTLCLSSMQRGWPVALYLLCLVPSAAGQGFLFPGTFMAILAVSDRDDQAVVTSSLILWRSLGTVVGVACTSLVLQNALWHYLERFVEDGPDKAVVVALVRRSVEAIRDLDPVYRDQAVHSYQASLRLTFFGCTLLAVVCLLLLVQVRLPRLGIKK